MRIKLFLSALLAACSLTAAEPASPADKTTTPVPGPKETSMEGSWQAYFTRSDIVVGRSAISYIFGKLGWAIRDGAKEAVVQDWYKRDGASLYLRPAEAPKDQPEMALIAKCEGSLAFTIDNPGTPGTGLRFERIVHDAPVPTAETVRGCYNIVQTNFDTKEERAAEYTLTLNADGTYAVVGHPAPTPPPFVSGTYKLADGLLTLIPSKPAEGFWANPKFFLYHGNWVCDNRLVAVSLKRITEEIQVNAPAPVPPKAD